MTIDWSAVRRIPPKSKGNRGYFPSSKIPSGIVEYESQIERDLYILFDHAPDVKIYQHQPVVIIYQDESGKERKYTPDTLVEFSNGLRGIIEIKDEATIVNDFDKFRERWEAAEKWCKERGMFFKVLSDTDIRTERLANIWFCIGAAKNSKINVFLQKMITLLKEFGDIGAEYNELTFFLSEKLGITINKASQVIAYAIYHGLVFVDTLSTSLLDGSTIIRKRKSLENSPFTPLNIEFNWMDNEFQVDHIERKYPEIEFTKDLGDNLIPEHLTDEVIQRKNVVENWLKRPSQKRSSQWRADFCKQWNVSQATVYRWVKSYQEEGLEGLIPGYEDRGRSSNYSETSLKILEEAKYRYLKPQGTFKKAYRYLENKCIEFSEEVPSESAFKYFVYNTTSASELAINKRGRKYHKSNYSPAMKSFQGAIMPMQVIQIDNTPFDVFPVDSFYRDVLSTPNLTAAVDCHTRMITGFYLSLAPSSSQTVLETIVQSILPKNSFEDKYDTRQNWPIEGYPVILLVDNGMDYRSEAVKEFCMEYDIILEFAPIRNPRYKAYIEQWFNILRNGLKDENIGGFRPLLRERIENPDLDPESEAVHTIQELNTWLTKWIVDEYHFNNPYQDNVPAPYLRWKQVVDGHTDIILPSPRDPPSERWEVNMMYLKTLKREQRVLKYSGVVWSHLKYNNEKLSEVYKKIGKHNFVTILIDRRDIRAIWVVNPVNEQPIQVDLASGWASTFLDLYGDKPISASAWKNQLKLFRNRNKSKISPYLYHQEISRIERQKILEESKRKTKSTRRKDEMDLEHSKKSVSSKLKPTVNKISEIEESKTEEEEIELPAIDPYPVDKKEDYN